MLNKIKLRKLAGRSYKFSGLDSRSECFDVKHFDAYPHPVQYDFNSRGFRDHEWPNVDELESAVWCIGDSFTVGLGSAFEHIWPQQLQTILGCRTIAVSMDGASNNWIARKCQEIFAEVRPRAFVLMWSYLQRREIPGQGDDMDRRQWYSGTEIEQDMENLRQCRRQVAAIGSHTKIMEFIIPSGVPESVESLSQNLCEETMNNVIQVPQLDWSRDHHHFDIITAQWVAQRATDQLAI